jgi:hypothetical protein
MEGNQPTRHGSLFSDLEASTSYEQFSCPVQQALSTLRREIGADADWSA